MGTPLMPVSGEGDLQVGRLALQCGDWQAARAAFQRAADVDADPRALEGLGHSTRWLGDVSAAFSARERAYQRYLEIGDDPAAARVAIWLAYDALTMRGDLAVAGGWYARARRLVEDLDSPERGWLAYREGELAIVGEHDCARARDLARVAAEIGRKHGVRDLEVVSLALRGLAEVTAGNVAAGMSCLDEAAVAAMVGEVSTFYIAGAVYCHLLNACERVGDLSRAAQWCDATLELAGRWHADQIFGVCRSHYAGLLIRRGQWAEAEKQLAEARQCFRSGAPALVFESSIRLATLRCRQGRFDEASALCERHRWHPQAQLCLVEAALGRGDLDDARELVNRHLDVLEPADRLLRAPGLELSIRIAVAAGDLAGAESALAELGPAATSTGTGPLRASLAFCAGLVAAARADLTGAQVRLADAVDLWTRDGAPYEAAMAQVELGQVRFRLGRLEAARREWSAASAAFTALGAVHAARNVELLLADDLAEVDGGPTRGQPLTEREVEVLRLVAQGLGDKEIASRLTLSPHTVHRHVANIRTKLNQPSRAAAVAQATRIKLI